MKSKNDYNLYMKGYMLTRYYRRRRKYIEMLGGKCIRCGSAAELEFDHVDRQTKSFDIGKRMSGASEAVLLRELEKCQLLCSTCHSNKSIEEVGANNGREVHGTLSSYRYCKCEKCREANNRYMREWKKNRKLELLKK